jgi:hypothetical protein
MTDFHILTTERLRKLVAETEATLAELKDELERRETLNQTQEIAHLENHMKSAELSLTTIRDFISFLVNDMRNEKK